MKKIAESPLPDKSCKTVNLEGYIRNNSDRMKYLEYKNKDYYIGSGMIESGNKTVVQKRMKQAGMRWSIAGGQFMAVLRAKHESHRWSDVVDYIYGMQKVS